MIESLRFHPVRRVRCGAPRLADIAAAVQAALEPLRPLLSHIPPGAPIALTCGSRGIDRLAEVVRAACAVLRAAGSSPFVVAAMGSHAGATAEGQRGLLAEFGVTAEGIGAPIVSSMETVSLGRTPEGIEAFMDRAAWEAGRVLILNRVKTHTDIYGEVESGLMKMMTVGLGNLEGALSYHENSMRVGFDKAILAMGRYILGDGRILAGLGLVENEQAELCEIAAAPAGEVEALDRQLLIRARALHAKLPFPSLDLLIVDEIGKNISGAGMDTKVIGRSVHPDRVPREIKDRIDIRRIYIRDLTPETAGNAIGMGLADVMHARIRDKIDFHFTYTNGDASLSYNAVSMPMSFPSDRAALEFLLRNLGLPSLEGVRGAWIHNTLSLASFLATSGCVADLAGHPDFEVGPPVAVEFDQAGNLTLGSGTPRPSRGGEQP